MAASAADFQQLVNTMALLAQAMTANVQMAAASVPAGGGGGKANGKGMRYIHPKAYSRVAKFCRGEDEWKEFYFDVGVILGTESPEMLKILRAIEARPGTDEFDTKVVRTHDEQKADQMEFERQSQELFEVLAMITEGEAKLMVRSVLTQGGIVAWERLYRHHNRRTMARVLRMQGCTRRRCTPNLSTTSAS
jgi:hypothetical protein